MRFSLQEKRDLTFAGLILSLAFAILFIGGWRGLSLIGGDFVFVFFVAFITAGIGFLLHELMHKYVAQNYGFYAEFKAFYPMLWLSVIFSFFGFIFAAPGGVFISGKINREKEGKISFAGPATNIVIAIIFLVPLLIFQSLGLSMHETLKGIVSYGFSINSVLALFNMIPVVPFDGAKVLAWDKGVYFTALVITLVLFIGSLFI